MPAFDMITLGCGGGPNEDNLSCYIVKPSNAPWADGYFSLEAGCGVGAINRLLKEKPYIFGRLQDGAAPSATTVYSWVKSFVITHPHLDHMNGLALSSQVLRAPATPVYAAPHTLEGIRAIFSGKMWPRLASDEESNLPLVLRPVSAHEGYQSIFPDVSIRSMTVSHGLSGEDKRPYESSAFFIRHDIFRQEFLFFGDVEPDSLAAQPGNRDVWNSAAPMIPDRLSTIFIECSWTSDRSDNMLFGHLNPQHLAAELEVLAKKVASVRQEPREESDADGRALKKLHRSAEGTPMAIEGALTGLRVYIIHCKDDIAGTYERPISRIIADQVRAQVNERRLGVDVLAVEQGMTITF